MSTQINAATSPAVANPQQGPKTLPSLSQIETHVKEKHPDFTQVQVVSKAQEILSKIESHEGQEAKPNALGTALAGNGQAAPVANTLGIA